MPERYNFVTDDFDDRDKGEDIIKDLIDFSNNLTLNEFERIGGSTSYFISGQSIEIDSNAGPIELTICLKSHGLSAVFINGPSETGFIKCDA